MKHRKIKLSFSSSLRSFLESLKTSWKLTLFTALFVFGLVIGSAILKSNDSTIATQLASIIESYILKRTSQGYLILFLNSLIPMLIYLYIAFAAGLCAVGIPIVIIEPIIKGLGVGIIAGYLYSTFELQGVGYCLLIIFPAAILSTATLIFACNESFLMSVDIIKILKDKQYSARENIFKLYLTRYSVLTIFVVFIALLDTFFIKAFSGLFNFY